MPKVAEPEISWIEPRFAIGPCPYAGDRDRIYDLGIRAVVTLHEPDERAAEAWADLGVKVISIPTPDWTDIPPTHFDRVVRAVGSCLDAQTPVLLHCLAGINRAPTFAAAVLCQRRGLAVDAALAAVRRARPSAAPTPEQEASLRQWVRIRTEGGSEEFRSGTEP
jgi:atypical dual specificity phosphatase